jgi:glutamine amidotransferase
MVRLRRSGLDAPIRDWVAQGRPLLGICLGLQLLFESSEEDGATTLGILPGQSRRLRDAPTLPHIGWNQVRRRRAHPLFEGLAEDVDLYFVHSYAGTPSKAAEDLILGETEHGRTFVSAVARSNLLGVQFHPERSGADGLRVLSNFVALAERANAGREAA